MDLVRQINQESLPVFVLNGDILGLSFSSYKESLKGFAAFVDAFTNKNKICDKVIFIPGNHDHHIWDLAKEEYFLESLKKSKAREVPDLQHITPATYDQGYNSNFFQAFMQDGATSPTELKILYPNFSFHQKKKVNRLFCFTMDILPSKPILLLARPCRLFILRCTIRQPWKS